MAEVEKYYVDDVKTIKKTQEKERDWYELLNERKAFRTYKLYFEFDPETNKTKIYKEKHDKIALISEYNGEIVKVKKDSGRTLLVTKIDGKYGLIDHTGKVLIPHEYKYGMSFTKIRGINRDFVRVHHDSGLGVVTLDGKVILPCEYSQIDLNESCYKNGEFRFLATKDSIDNWGVVDSKGNVLLDFCYGHNGETGVHYYRHVKEFGKKHLPYLSVHNWKTRKCEYINLLDDNIIATSETLAKMEKFEKKVKTKAEKRAKKYDCEMRMGDPSNIEENEYSLEQAIKDLIRLTD